ncbi:hypothetical protein BTHERMOSOX_583 [Bathymodiolus thermophilus thioautotrophic gill symbiont]|nr:hypothetical protein BTHERMOSOX_583 [Bathymodiolus thermophilus thioautotrophic gill symbiont]
MHGAFLYIFLLKEKLYTEIQGIGKIQYLSHEKFLQLLFW